MDFSFGYPVPVYHYFWAAIAEDKMFPQYDFVTGTENQFKDVPIDNIKLIVWAPFGTDLAKLVMDTQGIICVPNNNPPIEQKITKNAKPFLFRTHEESEYTYYACLVCGQNHYWDPVKDEKGRWQDNLKCPNCGAINEYICEYCKKKIKHPIFLKNNEVRCPVHEAMGDPKGLVKQERLLRLCGKKHEVHYLIGIKGMVYREYGPQGNLIRKGNKYDPTQGIVRVRK